MIVLPLLRQRISRRELAFVTFDDFIRKKGERTHEDTKVAGEEHRSDHLVSPIVLPRNILLRIV